MADTAYLVEITKPVEIVDPIDTNILGDVNLSQDTINSIAEKIGSSAAGAAGASFDVTPVSDAIATLEATQSEVAEQLNKTINDVYQSLSNVITQSSSNVNQSLQNVNQSLQNVNKILQKNLGNKYANDDCVIFEIALQLFANNMPMIVGEVSPQEIATNSIKSAEIFWSYFKARHPNII